MPARYSEHASPPDEAGHQGSFERDNQLALGGEVLPGATWQSPRDHEQPVQQETTIWVFALIALAIALAVIAQCAPLV